MTKNQSALFESARSANMPPMMQQYFNIKAEYQDCLLLFRLGDFYELFFNDAITAAPVLDVILTKRGKSSSDEQIPMCGVPYHSADIYFTKLIKAGYKLAVCEQMEKPAEAKKRGYKAVVNREVVRIITPGTLIEDNMLDGKYSQYLAVIHSVGEKICLIFADIATGKLWINQCVKTNLASELARINPSEIILSDNFYIGGGIKDILTPYKTKLTIRANNLFSNIRADEKIKSFYGIISLKSLIELNNLEIAALGALLEYISYTHKNTAPRLEKPRRMSSSNYLEIDHSTRKNLEINQSLSNDGKKTLLYLLDKSTTSMGKRLLMHYLTFPLTNALAINKRLDVIEFFINNQQVLTDVGTILTKICDQERILNKVYTQTAHFQDIINLMNSLAYSLEIANLLRNITFILPDNLKISLSQIGNFSDLSDYLNGILASNIESIQNKQYIKPGYSNKLDNLYDLKHNSNQLITNLRDKYRNDTGASNLKISFNNMLGYFIEVTSSQLSKITDQSYILRQSLVNGARFTTKELQELEFSILRCTHDIEIEEKQIFISICQKIMQHSDAISSNAQSIAIIDVACGLAHLAIKNNYVKPTVDDSQSFNIELARHPIVENCLKGEFIPNSCNMSNDEHLWLITGPNMAGKSTFLRQNALIIIMAQMGSFVPVKSAHLGVVDKLYSRIGASDDISSGHSTFMVEMIETANILNNSTSKSFLILDEVGRGTSTKDGLAIAWSIIENIHNTIKARTLFATHYHELTDLESHLTYSKCYTMKVKEWDDKIAFIHEIVPGKADKSYGIHVAELAGVPKSVIARASSLLDVLQKQPLSDFHHKNDPVD